MAGKNNKYPGVKRREFSYPENLHSGTVHSLIKPRNQEDTSEGFSQELQNEHFLSSLTLQTI